LIRSYLRMPSCLATARRPHGRYSDTRAAGTVAPLKRRHDWCTADNCRVVKRASRRGRVESGSESLSGRHRENAVRNDLAEDTRVSPRRLSMTHCESRPSPIGIGGPSEDHGDQLPVERRHGPRRSMTPGSGPDGTETAGGSRRRVPLPSRRRPAKCSTESTVPRRLPRPPRPRSLAGRLVATSTSMEPFPLWPVIVIAGDQSSVFSYAEEPYAI
jgi:hypothetical protein